MMRVKHCIAIGMTIFICGTIQPAYANTTIAERTASRRAERLSRYQAIHTPSSSRSFAREEQKKNRQKMRRNNITTRRIQRLQDAVITATNLERAQFSLSTLTYNRLLEQSAQKHADDMNKRNYFSHNTPEGKPPSQRMKTAGYGNLTMRTCNCTWFGVQFVENIAKGQKTVGNVMRDWMNSPDHRAAILSESLQEIGIGISGAYWVQNFGSIEITPR